MGEIPSWLTGEPEKPTIPAWSYGCDLKSTKQPPCARKIFTLTRLGTPVEPIELASSWRKANTRRFGSQYISAYDIGLNSAERADLTMDGIGVIPLPFGGGDVLPDPLPKPPTHNPPAKQQPKPPETIQDPDSEAPYGDIANATLLQQIHGQDLLYSGALGWYVYDGTRYQPSDSKSELLRAKDISRRLLSSANSKLHDAQAAKDEDWIKVAKAERTMAKATQQIGRLRAMLDTVAPEIAVLPDALDADPDLFNVLNGTLNVRTGELLPHKREHKITQLAPVLYDNDATAPLWDTFLSQVQPDAEVRRYIQRIIGSAMIGRVETHMLAIFWGGGSNGKGTFLEALVRVFGDYGWTMPVAEIIKGKGDRHETGLASLFRKRLVVTSESGDGSPLNEPLIKMLTGGDTITARHMQKDFMSFRPTHQIIMGTNYKPKVRGRDHGIWRRLQLGPWVVEIPAEDQDLELGQKLTTENTGILLWCLEGVADYLERGIAPPRQVLEATASYKDDEDLLGDWIDQRCEIGQGITETTHNELYASYKSWAEADGMQYPMTSNKLGRELEARGFTKASARKRNSYLRNGIRLLSPIELKAAERWVNDANDSHNNNNDKPDQGGFLL